MKGDRAMAHWIEDTRGLPSGKNQTSFGMDSMADVADLPGLSDGVAAGSDAFAAAEKQLVVLNSEGQWV